MKKDNLPTLEFMAGLYLNETDDHDNLLPLSIIHHKLHKYSQLIDSYQYMSCEEINCTINTFMENIVIGKLMEVTPKNFKRAFKYWNVSKSPNLKEIIWQRYSKYMSISDDQEMVESNSQINSEFALIA